MIRIEHEELVIVGGGRIRRRRADDRATQRMRDHQRGLPEGLEVGRDERVPELASAVGEQRRQLPSGAVDLTVDRVDRERLAIDALHAECGLLARLAEPEPALELRMPERRDAHRPRRVLVLGDEVLGAVGRLADQVVDQLAQPPHQQLEPQPHDQPARAMASSPDAACQLRADPLAPASRDRSRICTVPTQPAATITLSASIVLLAGLPCGSLGSRMV
jgi:hypothetical protein